MTFQTFTPKQAAKRLNLTTRTVLIKIRGGQIRASKLGPKTIRISERELYRLMDETKIEVFGKQLYD